MDKHISEVKLILILIIFQTRLAKLIHDEVGKNKEWDKYLGGVAYSINTQQQSTTKFSPLFLMFGRHPNKCEEVNQDLKMGLQF